MTESSPSKADYDKDLLGHSINLNMRGIAEALGRGANVNTTNASTGCTPLMCAILANKVTTPSVVSGYLKGIGANKYDVVEVHNIVYFLIANGANVHMKDIEGKTALMHAAFTVNVPVVDLLMSCGADVYCESVNGESALSFNNVVREYILCREARVLKNKLREIRSFLRNNPGPKLRKLNSMTINELSDIAKNGGMEFPSYVRKSIIIDVLLTDAYDSI